MISPENRLFCRLENMPGSDREQQRLTLLTELGLLDAESIPIFEEATQTAAHFLDAPICILGFIDHERQWIKSAVGLSRIGLMNDLASSRQLLRSEAFCSHVVDSHQVLAIEDTLTHVAFSQSILTHRYGIRSYLGVPLITSSGFCLGTLAIMGLKPRNFTLKDIELLELTARWSMSEFERNRLLKQQYPLMAHPSLTNNIVLDDAPPPSPVSVKADLITQMTQELRTPLTSILGMASVLNREIYGPLTDKQKEYMDIVHNSGQYLLSLVNEILELGTLDDNSRYLNLSPVDIEMLCQQALITLTQAAQRRDQQVRLTVEPGNRIWLLDKDKVRQMLYHLVFSVIQSSSTDSVIRIHVSRKRDRLNLTIWTSHPWLGEGLPQAELHSNQLLNPVAASGAELGRIDRVRSTQLDLDDSIGLLSHAVAPVITEEVDGEGIEPPKTRSSRQSLGVMLSRQLAEIHGGRITLQGSPEAGYRYVISLPQMTEIDSEEKEF